MPDVKARLQAIQLLLSESLGKAPTAPEPPTGRMPANAADVKKMSWDELTYVFGLTYADELREVARLGGPRALHEKLRGLSAPERQLLADALAQLDGPATVG
jgi:hypothetical protein